jgi:deoxyribose-phosphate aldolase
MDEIKRLCKICQEVDVNYIKTSTGINGTPATVEMVKTLKSLAGDEIKIKASAGIRTYDDAIQLINAGANRLGTSAGTKIVS